MLLDRVTTEPPLGAGPFRVTVPIDEVPPTTELGLSLMELRAAAVTVIFAVLVVTSIPVIVTDVLLATGLVVTGNVAEVVPAGTVTLAGTCAAAVLLLESVTSDPPAGAGPDNVTVPVEEVAPMTDVGLKLRPLRFGVLTVKLAVRVTP